MKKPAPTLAGRRPPLRLLRSPPPSSLPPLPAFPLPSRAPLYGKMSHLRTVEQVRLQVARLYNRVLPWLEGDAAAGLPPAAELLRVALAILREARECLADEETERRIVRLQARLQALERGGEGGGGRPGDGAGRPGPGGAGEGDDGPALN